MRPLWLGTAITSFALFIPIAAGQTVLRTRCQDQDVKV